MNIQAWYPAESDAIEIPAAALETKPWFWEEPGQALINEIKQWVRDTGKPHEWRGHTHTKPPPTAKPKYLDEFDVPTFGRKLSRVAPCPCCSPYHRKYKRNGKIAWFREEGVIRLIGPDCFERLNAEGHREAMSELNARRERDRAIRYLSGSLPRLEQVLAASDEVASIVFALEEVRKELNDALARQGMDLWSHCSTGFLEVYRKEMDLSVTKAGEVKTREIDVKVQYAPLRGYKLFDPATKPLDQKAVNVRTVFQRTVDQLRAHPDVADWSEDFRREALKSYNRARTDALALTEKISTLLLFFGTSAIPTLKTWGSLPEATMNIYVELVGSQLRIGRSERNWIKVDIRPALLKPIPDMSAIDPGIKAY